MALYPAALPASFPAVMLPDGGGLDPVTPCFYTEYDGIDDYYTIQDATVAFAGSFTFATEVWFDTLTNFDTIWITQDNAQGGFNLYVYADGRIEGVVRGTTSGSFTAPAGSAKTGQWQTIVLVVDDGVSSNIYVDDTPTAGATPSGIGATTRSPNRGALATDIDATVRALDGRLKNVTLRGGATSTPTSWTPTDPTSLVGTTAKFYSPNGSMEDSGLSVTKVGAPVQVECE